MNEDNKENSPQMNQLEARDDKDYNVSKNLNDLNPLTNSNAFNCKKTFRTTNTKSCEGYKHHAMIRDGNNDGDGVLGDITNVVNATNKPSKMKYGKTNDGKMIDAVENVDVTEGDTKIERGIDNEVYDNDENYDGKENSIRGKPSACVFVASLCASKSDDELCKSVRNHFQPYGKLMAVKVLRDTLNRPYAFVQFENDQQSSNAITKANNTTLDGRNLRCEAAKVNRTLFIDFKKNLNINNVKEVLKEFGELEQVLSSSMNGNININKTLNSKYWFIKFVYRDDAIRAFANLTNDSNFNIEWAQNIENTINKFEASYNPINHNSIQSNNNFKLNFDTHSIFIGKLSNDITELDLKKRFSRHGEIEHIDLINKHGNSFAFIKFFTEQGAARSVEIENHSMLKNKTIHVQYREFHDSKLKIYKENQKSGRGILLAPSPINSFKKASKNSVNTNINGRNFTTDNLHRGKMNHSKEFEYYYIPYHGAPSNSKRNINNSLYPKSNHARFNANNEHSSKNGRDYNYGTGNYRKNYDNTDTVPILAPNNYSYGPTNTSNTVTNPKNGPTTTRPSEGPKFKFNPKSNNFDPYYY